MGTIRRVLGAALACALMCLAVPAAASARSEMVTSFDGTQIKANFFPAGADGGEPAPTVLFGPGWSQPGATDPEQPSDPTVGYTGIGPLRAAGFNVLTWDPRGFGESGGVVTVDGPDAEARDVQELISFVARQPEAELDSEGDPRLGMTGASYGGGIQLTTAALDDRIDVIVPDIAWHSLTTSLYKDSTFKTGWGTLLYTLGKAVGTLDPHIDSAFFSGQATGRISAEDEEWFRSRGPGDLVERIEIPTMLVQGTVDTLFTLDEAITNYRILRGNGVPVKMLWFCGGHGSCLTDPGDPERVERATLAWLDRWLADNRKAKTGPGFDWLNQDGERFTAKRFPPSKPKSLAASGKGSLPLTALGGSGPSGSGPGTVGAIAGITNGTRAAERGRREGRGRRQGPPAGRRAEALARLLGHGVRPRRPRLRPARRRRDRRRPRQPGDADPATLDGAAHEVDAPARADRPHAAAGLERDPPDHPERDQLRRPARRRHRRLREHRPRAADDQARQGQAQPMKLATN